MDIVALADFAATTLPEEREQPRNKGKWFMDEPALPSYSVAEVQGF
jgi:cytochrome c oxidase subunit 3